ncbi:hypothetical protein B5X20_RS14220 [Vibrio parahaemolyticus]|nr:hypothetical protein [Vibrio parahaemolyticus]
MRRAVATSATLNVTHAAANPVAEMVDIYLKTSVGIECSDPTITNFAHKESAKGLYVAVGTYYVTVTVAGNPDAVAIDDGNNGGFNLLVDDITDKEEGR